MIELFLFLFTGIIGLITLVLLIKFYKSNPFCNFFLILIISILSFRFLIHSTFHLEIQTLVSPDEGVNSIIYLLIIPSFYLYYKNLTLPKSSYNLKDLKHLIFIVFVYFINSNEAIKNSFLFNFGLMTNFYLISVFLLFYLVLIFKMLNTKIWSRTNLLLNSKHFSLVKNWTLYLFVINVFSSLMLMIAIYKEANNTEVLSGKSMASFLLILWLFVFFKILTSPEILFGLPILNRTLLKFNDDDIENHLESESFQKTKTASKLATNWILETESEKNRQDQKLKENIKVNIEKYIKEVDRLSNENMIFRNQKFSHNDLAQTLGVPASHIVYLFKYHSKISFSEYRKNSRIQHAIALLEDGFLTTETLESLAHTVGFSSYNPFFSAFKKATTFAPQDYLKEKKN